MKRYVVIVTPEAEAGILDSFAYIHRRSPLNGRKWLRQLYGQIDTLEQFPERCPPARERDYLRDDLRQLIFKSHRIVFRVDKVAGSVQVLYVRHSKRLAIGEMEGTDHPTQ